MQPKQLYKKKFRYFKIFFGGYAEVSIFTKYLSFTN